MFGFLKKKLKESIDDIKKVFKKKARDFVKLLSYFFLLIFIYSFLGPFL